MRLTTFQLVDLLDKIAAAAVGIRFCPRCGFEDGSGLPFPSRCEGQCNWLMMTRSEGHEYMLDPHRVKALLLEWQRRTKDEL